MTDFPAGKLRGERVKGSDRNKKPGTGESARWMDSRKVGMSRYAIQFVVRITYSVYMIHYSLRIA